MDLAFERWRNLWPPSPPRSRRAILRAGLPPPWPEPPLRQLHRWASDMDGLLAEAAATGRPWTFDLWHQGRMAVFASDSARQTLREASPEELGHANDLAALFVGPHSLLLQNGAAHRVARRRTLGLIGAERLPVFGETMLQVAREWLGRLTPLVGSDRRVDVLDACQNVTLEIIQRTVLGMNPGPEADALRASARAFMLAGRSVAGNIAALMLPTHVLRAAVLGPQNPTGERPLLGRLGATLPGAAEGRTLVAHLRARIDRERAEPTGGVDVLARLVAEGELDDAAILDELTTLLLAGHDTTAVSLAWLFYRLGGRPELWARIRDELQDVFGEGPLEAARLPRRGLLGACVLESLRLDGLTIGMLRRARREVNVDGFRIPPGTLVNALVRPEHLSAERWDQPERFEPERMLGPRPSADGFAPFGGGYRRCVGAAFATFEMQIVLAAVARRVELHRPPELIVDRVQFGPFPGPSNRVPLWLRPPRTE